MKTLAARRLRRTSAFFVLVAGLTVWLQCGGTEDLSPAPETQEYLADGLEDCAVSPSLFLQFRSVAVSAGEHTLRLEASTYGDEPDSLYQTHFVCGVLGAGYDSTAAKDWFFTLNGIGDEKTLAFAASGTIYLGYVGTLPLGNHGSSVVSVDGQQQLELTAEGHSVIVADLWREFAPVEYDSAGAGTYEIALSRSAFSPRPGAQTPLVLVHLYRPNEQSRDFLLTSLNGVGDRVEVHLEPDDLVYAGFIDDLAVDNSGGSDVTVTYLGP